MVSVYRFNSVDLSVRGTPKAPMCVDPKLRDKKRKRIEDLKLFTKQGSETFTGVSPGASPGAMFGVGRGLGVPPGGGRMGHCHSHTQKESHPCYILLSSSIDKRELLRSTVHPVRTWGRPFCSAFASLLCAYGGVGAPPLTERGVRTSPLSAGCM